MPYADTLINIPCVNGDVFSYNDYIKKHHSRFAEAEKARLCMSSSSDPDTPLRLDHPSVRLAEPDNSYNR